MTRLYFFTLSGSTSVKAACKMLVKLTPDPKNANDTDDCLFCAFGICERKGYSNNVLVKLNPNRIFVIYINLNKTDKKL